jgi:hypothetical protein
MHTGAQRTPYQSMRVPVCAIQMAGNTLTVNMRTALVQVSGVQVRVSPLVAYDNSIEVRKNSNQCAFKKNSQREI